MHLKRQKVPKNWPVLRKGTKYVVRPRFDTKRGIPVLVLLRDVLGVVQNRKEAKRAIHLTHILVNNKPVRDEKKNVLLLDTLTLAPQNKHYKLEISGNGKFDLSEIKEKDSNFKCSKIIDKKVLKGKKVQLNLYDGRNFLSDIKCRTGDSVLINFKEKKVEKCLPLEEQAKVMVFAGKHSGKKGSVKKIDKENKIVELSVNEGDINVLTKQLMVIE
jgi:small subunit ribosomal protein S4e